MATVGRGELLGSYPREVRCGVRNHERVSIEVPPMRFGFVCGFSLLIREVLRTDQRSEVEVVGEEDSTCQKDEQVNDRPDGSDEQLLEQL